MELIYYWINKKKCIHEQGFCFSPEYNISMLKVEQGKYELKISRKKENNVFLSDVISNITVLVGDNGAGKTTLLKELWSLRCYPCENEDREEYQEFNKNENEKNKNLIILKKDDGQLYLYTNIYQKNIQIQGEIIKSIFYLSDYSSIASEFIRTSGEYFGFTKIYISNSYFDDLNGMSTNGKLDELAITPARLFFISSAFFEFICPDKTYNEKVNDFGRYSNWLKQNKDPDEFQQICDLMFYNFLIDEDFISDYEGFVQTQIRVNIYLAFTRIERAKMDGKIQESLWDIVKPVLDILHSKCIVDKAKDDLGYVLKTNFIFEWVLENGLEMLSTDDDIEAIYTKIVSVLGTKDISAANNLYFCDAANEIKEFTELLENIPSLKNDVPKKDLAYKSGREMEKYSRENILEASKWKEIIQYIADRVKISEEIFLGKRQYGSFLLRYLNIDNLMFSSGERVFQNVMSWIYFLGYFNKYIVKSEHHTRKDLLICLDEIDLSLHPAWQRDFVDYLVAYINSCYKENNVQIIMTTHSPLCLSNFPSSNIIYLRKTENGTEVDLSEHKETFGTNLYEILDDAFYLGCDSMGRFARKYIQKVIEEIMELSYLNQEDYYRYKQKIGCIGDTLIRNKLGEQLSKKLKETEGQRVAVDAIDKEIKQLELRRKKITEEMSGSTKISEE